MTKRHTPRSRSWGIQAVAVAQKNSVKPLMKTTTSPTSAEFSAFRTSRGPLGICFAP